jgi:hypothetical protein
MSNAALVPEHKITLDPDLVDNVARGSCVLFFGADHPAATPAPPRAANWPTPWPSAIPSGQWR